MANGAFALGPLERGARRLQSYKINYIPYYHIMVKHNLTCMVGYESNENYAKTIALIKIGLKLLIVLSTRIGKLGTMYV